MNIAVKTCVYEWLWTIELQEFTSPQIEKILSYIPMHVHIHTDHNTKWANSEVAPHETQVKWRSSVHTMAKDNKLVCELFTIKFT